MSVFLCSSAGDRVYNPGQGAAAPQDLSEGSVRPDAGLLAERAAHETQHQRNPLSAPQSGQSFTCIPGYTWLNPGGERMCVCMCVWVYVCGDGYCTLAYMCI